MKCFATACIDTVKLLDVLKEEKTVSYNWCSWLGISLSGLVAWGGEIGSETIKT